MWPVIFEIPLPGGGALPIRSFGLMVVIAFLVASSWMRRMCEREGTARRDQLEKLFFILLIAVVVGSRLMYVLTELDHFRTRPLDAFRIDKGGMVMYGGLIGCAVSGIWYLRRAKLPVWRIADTGGVAGALGIGIGRIGCLLVGDDFGRPCDPDFPLGIMFPTETKPGSLYGLEIRPDNGNLIDHAYQGVWLHPAQIYMAVNGFVLAAILYFLWKRKRFHGQTFLSFVILKAVTRSIIEEFRGDADRGFIGPVSTSQFIAALPVAAAIVMWIRLSKRPELRVPRAGAAEAAAG
jgi:phosphatidylglycerol---prolipoprotein diacylglyceryl transferase